jgi:hypothetical protein
MTPSIDQDSKLVEAASLAICHSGKFSCGGRCAPICFEFIGRKPRRCAHAVLVHGALARAIIPIVLEAAAREADPPLMHRKGKLGLWRIRRPAIAQAIRSLASDVKEDG